MALLNTIQDAEGSKAEKLLASTCLFREIAYLCSDDVPLRTAVNDFLGKAEQLTTEQVTGRRKPEFLACHEFVKNELKKLSH